MATITLPADQRNVLYAHIKPNLLAVDDLRLAIEAGELEVADRLGRRIASELRLIQAGLRWGDELDKPVDISLPAGELRAALQRLQDQAFDQYQSAQDEQEAFRHPWEQAAQVRDICAEVLGRLDGQPS